MPDLLSLNCCPVPNLCGCTEGTLPLSWEVDITGMLAGGAPGGCVLLYGCDTYDDLFELDATANPCVWIYAFPGEYPCGEYLFGWPCNPQLYLSVTIIGNAVTVHLYLTICGPIKATTVWPQIPPFYSPNCTIHWSKTVDIGSPDCDWDEVTLDYVDTVYGGLEGEPTWTCCDGSSAVVKVTAVF